MKQNWSAERYLFMLQQTREFQSKKNLKNITIISEKFFDAINNV